ncbi:MAG: NAD(P)/FAD-dependent oxidoreductase [Cellvibrionaceae bacterium]|nr:NAD(P)/FAD-dependent oxidoreductase [Cellvibrionaceae bacterium]
MKNYDAIIIGAGAAGLMCAWQAAARGLSVLLLERARRPGRKILMSGGGRCNFTNMAVGAENYLSENPHFVKSALKEYSQWDFIGAVIEHGVPYHERDHGQLFCDDSAADIVQLLLRECEQAGAELRCRCDIKAVSHNGRFALDTNLGQFQSPQLVVATGGLTVPSMGGGELGYQLASQFGLRLEPTRAGLVPFTFTDQLGQLFARLAGLAVPASIRAGKAEFTEALLFTHRGLSGPVCLQASNYWQPGQAISIDLLPGEDAPSLLRQWQQQQGKSKLASQLAKLLPKSLVQELEALWWPRLADTPLAQWPGKQLDEIARQLGQWQIKPSGTEGYRTAEVTLGGVSCAQLSSKTLEAKTQPGLHFIGEVVDVAGQLGGFNFQWAWSSAYACAQALKPS